MRTREAYRKFLDRVREIYDNSEADRITSMIFESVSGISKTEVIRKESESLDPDSMGKLESAFDRILRHEPVQYVIGSAWFYDYEFEVDPSVLIPRPETEELVECLLKEIRESQPAILDIGTGSGCIAVTIKKELPESIVTAIDSSGLALETAKRNAMRHEAEIEFQELDFLNDSAREKLGRFDVIISNPPYVPLSDKPGLAENVREFEPETALFPPGSDPLVFYRKIREFAENHLNAEGRIFLEIHPPFASRIEALFEKPGWNVGIKKDMFGAERIAIVNRCR